MNDGYTGGGYFDDHGGARKKKEASLFVVRSEKSATIPAVEIVDGLLDALLPKNHESADAYDDDDDGDRLYDLDYGNFANTTKYYHLCHEVDDYYASKLDVVRECKRCGTAFTVNRSYGNYECRRHPGSFVEKSGSIGWSCCGSLDPKRGTGCTYSEHESSHKFDDLYGLHGFPMVAQNGAQGPTWLLPLALLFFPSISVRLVRKSRMSFNMPEVVRKVILDGFDSIKVRLVFEETERIKFLKRYNDKKPFKGSDSKGEGVVCTIYYLTEGNYEIFERQFRWENDYVRVRLSSMKESIYVDVLKSFISVPLYENK